MSIDDGQQRGNIGHSRGGQQKTDNQPMQPDCCDIPVPYVRFVLPTDCERPGIRIVHSDPSQIYRNTLAAPALSKNRQPSVNWTFSFTQCKNPISQQCDAVLAALIEINRCCAHDCMKALRPGIWQDRVSLLKKQARSSRRKVAHKFGTFQHPQRKVD